MPITRSRVPILAFLATSGLFTAAAHAQLAVTPIPWVQENPQIPHIALNAMPTMLQAIAEGGNCASYTYRWDWNGDGDYADANEGNLNAAKAASYAGYFAPLPLNVQLPVAAGDRLYYPKVEVTCGAEVATAIMPVVVRVDRVCGGLQQANCTADQNLDLTRNLYAARAIDRALWYMFTNFQHQTHDGQGNNVHTCWYAASNPVMYGTGHAINAFERRGHAFGPGRDTDPYYRHLTQCGINALLTTMNMASSTYFDDDAGLGVNQQYIDNVTGVMDGTFWGVESYATTAWVEPIIGFGNRDYVAPRRARRHPRPHPARPRSGPRRRPRSVDEQLGDGRWLVLHDPQRWRDVPRRRVDQRLGPRGPAPARAQVRRTDLSVGEGPPTPLAAEPLPERSVHVPLRRWPPVRQRPGGLRLDGRPDL